MEIKSAALIGLGAMGVFFAPRMAESMGAENFCVIAEGERKKRLETQGVTINGTNYLFPICEPANGKPVDLIIMATKYMGLCGAIKDIKAFVGEHTQILCVMNGVESEEMVSEVYGASHVLYSFMRMSIVMKDGKADFDPYWGKIHFGEADNSPLSPRTAAIRDLFIRCDIPYEIDTDMIRGMWFKFMCNVGENLTCALLSIPFGVFRTSEHANWIRTAAMEEVLAIAIKKGIALSKQDILDQYQTLCTIPYENKPSTLQDLENGRKTEIDMFAGNVIRMGRELGIKTPINELLFHAIHAYEER